MLLKPRGMLLNLQRSLGKYTLCGIRSSLIHPKIGGFVMNADEEALLFQSINQSIVFQCFDSIPSSLLNSYDPT